MTHLVGLGAGQAAGQRSTVGRQGGGERWAAVGQNGLQVTGGLLRIENSREVQTETNPVTKTSSILLIICMLLFTEVNCAFQIFFIFLVARVIEISHFRLKSHTFQPLAQACQQSGRVSGWCGQRRGLTGCR